MREWSVGFGINEGTALFELRCENYVVGTSLWELRCENCVVRTALWELRCLNYVVRTDVVGTSLFIQRRFDRLRLIAKQLITK